MTALAATAGQNGTTALGAGTNQEAVRTGTLDLGGLVGTLGSHVGNTSCSYSGRRKTAALPNGAMLRGEQNSGVMVTHWIVYIQIEKVSTKT